jgi:CRISPR/Cas system-associated exonuclease Cas4 (RecB family)
MDQEYADQDTQLALYAIWVKQEFKEAREVKLIWHYVKVGEDVVSVRTDEKLKQLKEDILAQIKKINRAEAEDDFPAQETKCEWCGYWQYCPKKKHLYKVEKLPENEYLKEDGVQLARKYIELSDKRLEINKRARTEIELINGEMEKVKEAIIKYAKEHQTEVLDGGDRVVVVNKKESYDIPTKTADKERYDKLEEILKKTKYWPAVSSVNGSKLASLLQSGAIDNKLAAKLQELITKREDIGLSVRKK